jgi:hypothetical protein
LSFGSQGIALWGTADGFFNVLNATSLVLQPSGDIVVAGSEQTDRFGVNSLGIIRLRPNGTFDPSFGSNGVVTANTNSVGLDQFTPALLAQEPNGDIVAEGTFFLTAFGFIGELGLAEFTAGSPDSDQAAGLASPSAAILGQGGDSLDLGGEAIALPATATASSVPSTAAGLPATTLSGSRSAAFFAWLSEGVPHAVSNPESGGADVPEPSALDALFASL